MYAAEQQFVGAGDEQEEIRDAWGAINRAPMQGVYEMTTEGTINRAPTAAEPPPGNLIGQTVQAAEMLLPLVPQENQASMMPIQAPHTASKTPDGQPASWYRISLEQSTMSDHKGPHPYEEYEVGHDGRRKRPHPTSPPPPPLREAQGRLPEATLVPSVVDVPSVQRQAELKTIRPQQDISQVGRMGHSYDKGNQHEVAPITQELSTPAPTIQVTIGRIEVRATPPPAPHSQPKRSGPPVMGLEEYLNQRAKGGY